MKAHHEGKILRLRASPLAQDNTSPRNSRDSEYHSALCADITPTPCQNNMIYELMAFRDMIRGVRDFIPYLEESEALMRAHDLIVKAQNR